ncbi:MAG: hypothetical protein B6I29_01130 [Marinitoga sp. 4572_148]|nr:MAG: hypothetical protein B6I29_01130 [Marinitoga sp. 4572_148]
MAKKYRDLIFSENVLNKKANNPDIPLALEVVLNDIEKKLFGFSTLQVSSIEFLKSKTKLKILL